MELFWVVLITIFLALLLRMVYRFGYHRGYKTGGTYVLGQWKEEIRKMEDGEE